MAVVTLLLGEVTEPVLLLLLLPREALDLLRTDMSPESFLPSTFLLDLLRKGRISVQLHFYETESVNSRSHISLKRILVYPI